MRNRLEHVPADDEVEAAVRKPETEGGAVLEPEPLAERDVPATSHLEMALDDVDAEHRRARVERREPGGDLPRPATCVEDPDIVLEGVAAEERLLLRPDRDRLRGEVADHRLVRHLLCLGIQIVVHGQILPCRTGRAESARGMDAVRGLR